MTLPIAADQSTLTVEVLIVGAGPVGLTAAIALSQQGISNAIIERRPARDRRTSRAMVLHARTLEVLKPLGVTEHLVAAGHHTTSFALHDHEKTLLRIDFDQLPSDYPFMNMLPQWHTEEILEHRLHALGGSVRYGWSLATLDQSADATTATVIDAHGQSQRVEAAFVIGADGARSTVRQAVGLSFPGRDYDGSYLLADVEMSCDLDRTLLHTFVSSDGVMVLETLPDGQWRILTNDSTTDDPPLTSASDIEALVHSRATRDAHVLQVCSASRYRVARRLVDDFRCGRVVLAGDAAHVHSPAGGQGMNTGIQDAVVLAGSLYRALRLGDGDAVQRYADQRRAAARNVLTLTDRITRLLTVRHRGLRAVLYRALSVVSRSPRLRLSLAMRMSQLAGQPHSFTATGDTTGRAKIPAAR